MSEGIGAKQAGGADALQGVLADAVARTTCPSSWRCRGIPAA